MKGRAIEYSWLEWAFLSARRELPRKELHRQFVDMFGRDDVTVEHIKALCTREGWKTGRTGCFVKGQAAWNKGTHFSPAGSEKGRFKKGNRPHTYKGPGHEYLGKDGYIILIVADDERPGKTRQVLKHVHLWQEANGQIPEGHCLKCLDGDRTNTDPSNWEAIPRALLPRLSGGRWYQPYDAYEPELRPAVLSLAKLHHAAREAKSEGGKA